MSDMSETHQEQPKSKTNILLVVLFLLSLAGNGYLMYSWYNTHYSDGKSLTEINAELTEALSKSNLSLDSLQEKYNDLEQLYQSLQMEYSSMEMSNDSLTKAIEKQKIEIRRLFNSSNRLALIEANNKLKLMEETLAAARTQLDDAQRDRENLRASVDELSSENEQLVTQKQKKDRQVQDLESKLKQAKFQIDELAVKPLRDRRGRLEETTKANKIKEIEISFVVVESELVEHGDKEIVLRILGTNGEVLGANNDVLSDSDKLVSMTETFKFTGQSEKIKFTYNQEATYKKGGYTAEIWHDGERLVRTQFNLD